MNFIVFSDDWGRHASSCQHIFSYIAQNKKVLWVNTVGLRVPQVGRQYDRRRSLQKILSWLWPVRKARKNLYVFSPFMLPYQQNRLMNLINTISVVVGIRVVKFFLGFGKVITWTTVPNVGNITGNLGESCIIYNCTDDYSLWPGGNRSFILCQERTVLEKSDLVLASSKSLVDHCKLHNEHVRLFPHAVDIDHFTFAKKPAVPEKMKNIPRPVIGFFGLLYEKINYSLLKKIAIAYHDVSIVLIGKQGVDLTELHQYPNIFLLGPVPYDQLPAYAVHFDVGLMPYVLDEEIRKSAPLKLKEYLALGFPVVSVHVTDVETYAEHVHIADSDDEFVEKVGIALKEKDGDKRQSRQNAVKNESWQKRIEFFSGILKENYGIAV